MASTEDDLAIKKSLLAELKAFNSGYIIVQEEILHLLIGAAPNHLVQAAQRILHGQRPTLMELDPNSPTVSWDVKVLRKAHKISQAKLALKAEMEQPDVSEFERGGNAGFGEDRKKRIVDALKTIISESTVR